MSWEPCLVKTDGQPLGTPDEIRHAITLEFPKTKWNLEPGGNDLLEQIMSYGSNISTEWRAMILQTEPSWRGTYDTDPVTVEFNLGPGEQIMWVNVTSRGDHAEAQRRLRKLARDMGWLIKGDFDEHGQSSRWS
jgi:hypothetical protein